MTFEKSSEISHFKNCDFWKFIFLKSVTGNRLPSRCNRLHINICDSSCLNLKIKMFRNSGNRLQVLFNRLHKFKMIWKGFITCCDFWNLKSNVLKHGNRLHAHGNRLQLCKSVLKTMLSTGNQFLPSGSRLLESKTLW